MNHELVNMQNAIIADGYPDPVKALVDCTRVLYNLEILAGNAGDTKLAMEVSHARTFVRTNAEDLARQQAARIAAEGESE